MSIPNFSIQKSSAFGTYGEFSVGTGVTQIRAQYVLTKIRPGNHGFWENQLASQMAPWREIFRVEELSFDELVQRDLDDSRVAHDLIPYLLGETGQHARFFPPVLAVLVPKREDRSGISPRYPEPTVSGESVFFGDLFDFEKIKFNDIVSPLGHINYNPQRTAVVIVDGQHRAMAVLALHRQINKSWGSDPFAPYYDHIQVTAEDVAHIELPVCILFFPDIHEGSTKIREAGIDLVTVCREIFIVVNRQAKPVSKSRELLLDDEDFAAFMMRRTLTRFKDNANTAGAPRIYSFTFGDSEADNVSQVMAGRLEYCSAVALHKMHAAAAFGLPAAFSLIKTADVTDGRNVRNPTRPVEILTGSGCISTQAISRRSAKTHTPKEVETVTQMIGDLTDSVMFPLFNGLRPFAAHNRAMEELLAALNDPTSRADPIQSKVRALLFDGSSNRSVFDEHIIRLKERGEELRDRGQAVPAHISIQLSYCDSVNKALKSREDEVKLGRAYILFNIDPAGFTGREESLVESELPILRARGKSIFDAVSTQAFQIGYLMATLTQVEFLLPPAVTYEWRLKATKFVSLLFLNAMNCFFAVAQTRHRTLSGYVSDSRANAFDAEAQGFRGLLAATNVRELNEKQWEFFRYMVFEVVHSKMASNSVLEALNSAEFSEIAQEYRLKLPLILESIEKIRNRYFDAAFKTATNATDFKRQVELIQLNSKVSGKSEEEIRQLVEHEVSVKKTSVFEECKKHLEASLGRLETKTQVLNRLVSSGSSESNASVIAEELNQGASQATGSENLGVAIVAEDLINKTLTRIEEDI